MRDILIVLAIVLLLAFWVAPKAKAEPCVDQEPEVGSDREFLTSFKEPYRVTSEGIFDARGVFVPKRPGTLIPQTTEPTRTYDRGKVVEVGSVDDYSQCHES